MESWMFPPPPCMYVTVSVPFGNLGQGWILIKDRTVYSNNQPNWTDGEVYSYKFIATSSLSGSHNRVVFYFPPSPLLTCSQPFSASDTDQ